MADLATLQTRLTEAETALHKIVTGSMVEEITSPSGERVRYMASNVSELRTYIGSLQLQVSQASATSRKRGPIYPVYDPY